MAPFSSSGQKKLCRLGSFLLILLSSSPLGVWGPAPPRDASNKEMLDALMAMSKNMEIMRTEYPMAMESLETTLELQQKLMKHIETSLTAAGVLTAFFLPFFVIKGLSTGETGTRGDGLPTHSKTQSGIANVVLTAVHKIRQKIFEFFFHKWKMVFNAVTNLGGWLETAPEDTNFGTNHFQDNDTHDMATKKHPPNTKMPNASGNSDQKSGQNSGKNSSSTR